jgi:hypothetical protein
MLANLDALTQWASGAAPGDKISEDASIDQNAAKPAVPNRWTLVHGSPTVADQSPVARTGRGKLKLVSSGDQADG